jgi:cell division protein FtsB
MGRKGKLIIVGGVILLLGFLFVIALGDRGAVDLYHLRQERDRLKADNILIEEENRERYETVERLRNDAEFVEDIARSEFGMVKEDEIVILKKKR